MPGRAGGCRGGAPHAARSQRGGCLRCPGLHSPQLNPPPHPCRATSGWPPSRATLTARAACSPLPPTPLKRCGWRGGREGGREGGRAGRQGKTERPRLLRPRRPAVPRAASACAAVPWHPIPQGTTNPEVPSFCGYFGWTECPARSACVWCVAACRPLPAAGAAGFGDAAGGAHPARPPCRPLTLLLPPPSSLPAATLTSSASSASTGAARRRRSEAPPARRQGGAAQAPPALPHLCPVPPCDLLPRRPRASPSPLHPGITACMRGGG